MHKTMMMVTKLVLICVLSTLFCSEVEAQNTITVNVFYPEVNLCKNCSLLIGTSLNDFQIYNENGTVLPEVRLNKQGGNLFTATIQVPSSVGVGSVISLTPVYIIDVRLPFGDFSVRDALKELIQIELNCFNLLLGTTVRALGPQTNITLVTGNNPVNIYPYFCTQEGKLQTTVGLYSPQFGDKREIYTLIPPSIVENPTPRQVNVFVMSDGQWANWIAHDIYSLLNNGQISETVVIGVASNEQRNYELTPTVCNPSCQSCAGFTPSGGGSEYINFLADTVIPTIMTNISMTYNKSTTGIFGYSLGGLMACWAPYLRPDIFSFSYCGSPTLSWNCQEFGTTEVPNNPTLIPSKAYIDYGTGEGSIQSVPAQQAFEALLAQGMVGEENLWLYASYGDYHETNSWKHRFWRAATDLLSN